MPSGRTRFAVYDTSVYIEEFRTGRFTERMLRSTWIPRCSAVVLHELLRGARTRDELAFARALSRNCRVLTPTEGHWTQAAELLRTLRRRGHFEGTGLARLALDVLIALTARSIGATLVTTNVVDYEVIRRLLRFQVVYW